MPAQDDLAEALDRDEIVPYFQPLVELLTGRLKGFEVLSRWNHPVHGMISPDRFIPLAEETGLIGLLSEKILNKAFAVGSGIPSPLSLSVNISPIQFHDLNLPQHIQQAAQKGGFDFHRLILEITETALVDNMQQARAIFMDLKELGVRLALDDFGTGYSSLHHLQALPFDELKIDASFIRSMDRTRESRKIAAAVVGLGHSLGLITVAEGIETRTQAEMLLWLGCEYGQGWLYGRPVPANEIPGILSRDSLLPPDEASTDPSSGPTTTRLEALPTQRLAQLQAVYDGAPVGLCFLDTNMRYMSINKRLAKMNGVSVAYHIGRRVVDLHPEMFGKIEPNIRRALKGESLSGIEVTAPGIGPDERIHTLLASYEPVRDEADEVIGVVVAVIDITSRKAAEEALLASEDRYRNAVELNPHIPWTTNADFTDIEISPSWEKLTGMPVDRISGHGWLDVVHPGDADRAQNTVGASIRTGEPLDLELRVKRADGVWIWMRSRGSPRRDSMGKIIRWYGSMEDIDDRKKMEHALVESESLLKAVFDAAPVGIVIAAAPEGRILMSNPLAEDIFKRPFTAEDKIDDYRRPGVYHPSGQPLEPSEFPLARAIVTGKPTGPLELRYRRLDGSDTWIRASASPVRGHDGEVVGGVVALLDIDDLKRDRQAVLDRIAELERQIDLLRNPPAPTELQSD